MRTRLLKMGVFKIQVYQLLECPLLIRIRFSSQGQPFSHMLILASYTLMDLFASKPELIPCLDQKQQVVCETGLAKDPAL